MSNESAPVQTGPNPIGKPAALLEIDAARGRHQERALVMRRRFGAVAKVLALALLIALTLRSLVFEPFTITSPSMQPGLLTGDYLFVAKWPYGYSRYSFPLSPPLFAGRMPANLGPARGDVVVFKSAFDNRTDFIKRVIGLPGDTVALVDGQVILNGAALPQRLAAGQPGCSAALPGCPDRMMVEHFPGRRGHVVADTVTGSRYDNFAAVTVPAGHYFVLGDNRDNSADSRGARGDGGAGMVPAVNIIGRADRAFVSIDRAALGWSPRQWWRAVRTERIGAQF
ncbi:MAG: signal peptidase I [Polymorphobacter sp.]